jgi:Rrf2 family protein
MRVSKKLEYAVRALIYMAGQEKEKNFLIRDIADKNKIPKKFLELILLELKNSGLLSSKRGVSGGYSFFISPSKITFYDVYRAIQGEVEPTDCVREGDKECEASVDPSWCGLRFVMDEVRANLEESMRKWTIKKISDLEREMKLKSDREIMYYI